MDSTLFLFLQIIALSSLLYGIERNDWRGLLIFLSTALFFALSLASFDIEHSYAFLNETSGLVIQQTFSSYEPTYAYFNSGLGLLSLGIGIIKVIVFKDSNKQEE